MGSRRRAHGPDSCVAANLQHFSGKPWAATAQAALPQGDVRIFLEPRGARRLPSQSLLDIRVSKNDAPRRRRPHRAPRDLLNVLNDDAEESLATDNLFSPTNSCAGVAFVDPRRAMLGVRLELSADSLAWGEAPGRSTRVV